MTKTVQVRKKGTFTIPSELRKQYNIEEDDPITLVDTGEGIFLSPKRAVLPKLVGEIESLMKKHNVSLDELIKSVQKERK
jgi:AbrB family looped-hinge helix DNA binding protein